MLVTKQSGFTGKINTREIDVTEQQLANWRAGTLIQVAMPYLSTDDREFLMTGVTPEEWEATFGPSKPAKPFTGIDMTVGAVLNHKSGS